MADVKDGSIQYALRQMEDPVLRSQLDAALRLVEGLTAREKTLRGELAAALLERDKWITRAAQTGRRVVQLLNERDAMACIVDLVSKLNCCDGDDARRTPEMQEALDRYAALPTPTREGGE